MASLTDDPMLVKSRQSARRDQSLMQRQYRRLKRSGDSWGAMQVARQADEMGLPVGRPVNDAEIEGAGNVNYAMRLARSRESGQPGGLAGYDFRQQKDQISGLGQKFRNIWRSASTPQEQDDVVFQAAEAGVPLTEAGQGYLRRRETGAYGEKSKPSIMGEQETTPEAGAEGDTGGTGTIGRLSRSSDGYDGIRASAWKRAMDKVKTPQEMDSLNEQASKYGVDVGESYENKARRSIRRSGKFITSSLY